MLGTHQRVNHLLHGFKVLAYHLASQYAMVHQPLPKTKAQKNAEKRQRYKNIRQTKRGEAERLDRQHALHAQVLSTTELLEMILLQLPLKDLLLAQRVSTKWKAVIDASPDLQKALFFQPATSQIAFFHAGSMYHPHGFENGYFGGFFYLCPPDNDHLAAVGRYEKSRNQRSGKAFSSDSALISSVAQMKQDREALRSVVSRTPVFLNPLLLAKFPWCHYFFNNYVDDKYQTSVIYKDRKVLRLSRSAKRPEASWRRMLITQPPRAALTAKIRQTAICWNWMGKNDLSRPLRMEKFRACLAHPEDANLWLIEFYQAEAFKVWQSGGDLARIKMGKTIEEEQRLGIGGSLKERIEAIRTFALARKP